MSPIPETERGPSLASRAFAAILSPFRRRPTEEFETAHIARSTPALLQRRDQTPLDTWHSWGSELSIASKLADDTRHLSPTAAGQRRLRRSLSGTLVKRVRTPSVMASIAPQVAIDAMLGKPDLGASQTSLGSTSTRPPQISLDFDWGPSASDLPSDALCETLDEPDYPGPPSSYAVSTRPQGLSTSTSSASFTAPTKSKPKLRRLGSRRFLHSVKSGPVPSPLPRIELELVEDGFCVNFAVIEDESVEGKVPGAWA
ncbi:hypothetical protein CspeluHIS016_0600410 [Cutaneotrichosporon spelunceum]|uniref:Uncharacterized protein n=1 Tax=Cutaneotrichosporon spelunceum TaxID=1672016 RepID=A0AAD3YE38_9TREE|nr:hypothetical protein CspeluHIS016_0600410 [Cutaneotrichosporon spelunceum]